MTRAAIDLTCYLIGIAGGIALLFGSSTQRMLAGSAWIRLALRMGSFWTLIWASLGLAISFRSQLSIGTGFSGLLFRYKTLAGGATLGIFVLFVSSSEVWRLMNSRKKPAGSVPTS